MTVLLPDSLQGLQAPHWVISNSEVVDMNKCERLHLLKHGMRLTRDKESTALSTGITGHDVLKTFFQAIKDGAGFMEAVTKAYDSIDVFDIEDDVYIMLKDRLMRFFVEFRKVSWELLDVEGKYVVPMTDEWSFGLRLDILARLTDGPNAGKLAIIDWKFQQNFLSDWQAYLHIQLKKYRWALERLDIKVDKLYLAQIRTHKAAKDKFELREIHTTPPQELFLMEQHVQTAEHILRFRSIDPEDWAKSARYALNSQNCDYCGFAKICTARMKGEDTREIMRVHYRTDTYGYNNDVEAIK